MNFKGKLNTFGNLGVKTTYHPWEVFLTRKLNFLCLIGILNVTIGLTAFLIFGFTDFLFECLFVLAMAPLVIILNIKKNYIWALYVFYLIGIVLFSFLMLKMGMNSFSIILYFPILISLVQMLGRKETILHMFIIMLLYFVSIAAVLAGYKQGFMAMKLDDSELYILRTINVLASFSSGIMLISVVTIESNKQEKQIRDMLREKEVLIAEVFHRVKNNMNIVTSLLNLKKYNSDSEEVKDALEECRNRVFSMALVHQKIYSNKNLTSLNFKEYTHDLVKESIYSHSGEESVDIKIDAEDVELQLPHAVPCGLILNELITNSFKHGRVETKKLQITISLSSNNGIIELSVKDNGPGISEQTSKNKDSLGMELIRSLSEQIDGTYSFNNVNGCGFNLKFKS